MTKKLVTWGSPKEYQPNHTPRKLKRAKKRNYCTKYKGEHQMVLHERTGINSFNTQLQKLFGKAWLELRCSGCGRKQIKYEK